MMRPELDPAITTLEAPQIVCIPAGYIFATWPAHNTTATEAIHKILAECSKA